MIKCDELLKQLESYDVVTFDVFDTLIIRDVVKPVDVFTFTYGPIGRYFRTFAEKISRKFSKTGEVTLEDIEKYCPFSCKKEIEFEKNICRANPVIFDVYNELKKSGKQIYAISDMYLSEEVIQEILHNAGYDIKLYVSNKYNCSKNGGKLFEVFLKEEQISTDKVIHIGDNRNADGDGANKAGIKSVVIDKDVKQLKYTPYKNNYELASFINHGLNNLDDPVKKIGYEIIGPLVLSYVQWVHRKKEEYGFDRLYFLARDMHFTYDVYSKIYDDDIRYLSVSRKSLARANENSKEFINYLKKEECYGNIAIVDTGWVGLAQVEIEKYAKMINPDTDLGALYMGTKKAFRKLKRSSRSDACFYKTKKEQFRCTIATSFLETLIGINEPQVIDYIDGNPIFDRDETDDDTSLLKEGAIAFIDDWIKFKNNKEIDAKKAIKAFEKIFIKPKNEDVILIGNLQFEDIKETKIVSYDSNCLYLIHPGKLITDLSDSAWKGAFLRKTGCLYPVMMKIYRFVGTVRINRFDKDRCKDDVECEP